MAKIKVQDPREIGGKMYVTGVYEIADNLVDEAVRKGATVLEAAKKKAAPKKKAAKKAPAKKKAATKKKK